MAFAPASTFPAADPIKTMFEKQVSEGSTVLPARDDFYRDTSLEQDLLLDDLDVFEARGGMAEKLAWQLPAPSEDQRRATFAASVGSEEVDLCEARGGMAEQLRAAAGTDMDEYEARGGAAAKVHCMLPSCGTRHRLPTVSEGDEYEMRGGFAAWSAVKASAMQGELADVDVFEARGGMAGELAWQLSDLAEDRQCAARVLLAGGEELDFYEARGGLAEHLRAVAGLDMDEYEARGGLAARVHCTLPSCGAKRCLPRASEGDEYEMRGGMAAWSAASAVV